MAVVPSLSDAERYSGELITLATAPECSERYDGPYRSASIFIIARGTEHERLYVKKDMVTAQTLARRNSWTLDRVRAESLCREPMLRLLGA
jgi:hypothetical protein